LAVWPQTTPPTTTIKQVYTAQGRAKNLHIALVNEYQGVLRWRAVMHAPI
jgi:hypothetical protein